VKLKAHLGVAVFFVTALSSQAEITGELHRDRASVQIFPDSLAIQIELD
jgi:hypothetical protein